MKAAPVSLRRQLIWWNVVTLAILLTALGLVTRFAAASAIMRSVDRQLEEQVHPPRGGPLDHGFPGGFGFSPGFSPGFPPPPDEHHPRIFDSQGHSRHDPAEVPWDRAALADAARGRKVFTTVTVGGEPLRVMSQPGALPGDVLQVSYPLTEVNRAVAGLDHTLLLLLPIALLGAGIGGAALTTRVLRPIRQITQAAARMGEIPSARLPAVGEDEFAEMAATFNGLLNRLDGSFQQQARLLEQQRRFIADASHELKTPLTVIQGTASQMSLADMSEENRMSEEDRRQALAEIGQAAAGMARLVQDLLLLARSDEGQLGRNRITVLAREVLTQAAARVCPGRITLSLCPEDQTLTLWGNQEELIRLFTNLLQNAARAAAGDEEVTLSARRQGQDAVVTVTDHGIGIAPEHLAHLGERFYRVDSARARRAGGTGLGLSICRGIVEAHGGTLAFASYPGKGTTVTVTLKTEE